MFARGSGVHERLIFQSEVKNEIRERRGSILVYQNFFGVKQKMQYEGGIRFVKNSFFKAKRNIRWIYGKILNEEENEIR